MRTRDTGCAVFSRGKTDCLFGVFKISVLHFGKQLLRQREIRLIGVQYDVLPMKFSKVTTQHPCAWVVSLLFNDSKYCIELGISILHGCFCDGV